MEKVNDTVDAVPISSNVMGDSKGNHLDSGGAANTKNDNFTDLQDSDVETKSAAPNAIQRKKAYTCKRCGNPLKGHTCIANPMSLPAYFVARGKRKRTKNLHLNIEGEANEHHRATATKEMNNSTTQNFSKIKESSKESSVADQSRNWYDDDDDDDDRGIKRTVGDKRRKPRKRVIQSDSSSDDDDDRAHDMNDAVLVPQTSFKRSYTCRACGVPRKGHICPFDGDENSNRHGHQQPLSRTPPNSNHKNQRHRSKYFENISVMERTEYNSGSDSNDDDDDVDDDDRIQSTEILIPAHVFMDEIHFYIFEQQQAGEETHLRQNAKKLTDIDAKSLQTWATNVYSKFEKLNELAYDEMQRNSKQKQIEQSTMKERDMIVLLNSKIRCIKNDSRTIADHVMALRNEHHRNIATSRFLSTIDAMRGK